MMTHSIYADTSSYAFAAVSASHADYADSASYALSSSHAISASHALVADIANFYPPQQFQISCSWASRSLQSWYATRSIDVDTHGRSYNFPYWVSNTPGAGNGNLVQDSPIVFYQYSGDIGLESFDSASTNLDYYFPYPNHRPDFKTWQYGNRANVAWGFAPNLGIQSHWPITSHTFVGTDQRDWYFTTSSNPHYGFDPDLQVTNSYFSGSAGDASSGSFYTIPEAPGALASIFNGKWIRLACNGGNPAFAGDSIAGGKATADHSAMGEMWANEDQIFKGLISIQLQAHYANAWNQVDIWVHSGGWAGNQSATILHVNNYGPQLIRAFRLSGKGGGLTDPLFAIDMLVDGIWGIGDGGRQGEDSIIIKAQSWQGIRFLKWLNIDPWPFENTGSNDLSQDGTQLIFPSAPGFYTNTPKAMNYNIQGQNVQIWPSPNVITQSGLAVPMTVNSHSLFVSGGINTNEAYYCDNNKGITTKILANTNVNLYFSGGILVDKYPPDVYIPPVGPPSTLCSGPFNYVADGGSDGTSVMVQDQTYQIGSNTGVVQFRFDTNRGGFPPPGIYSDATRYQVIIGGNVVMDSDWRGKNGNASHIFALSQSLSYYNQSPYTWPSTIPSILIANGPTPTYIVTSILGTYLDLYFYKSTTDTTATVRMINPSYYWSNYTMSCPGISL
jgi:hypothetical protein